MSAFDPLMNLSDGQLIVLIMGSYTVAYWLTVYIFGNPYRTPDTTPDGE